MMILWKWQMVVVMEKKKVRGISLKKGIQMHLLEDITVLLWMMQLELSLVRLVGWQQVRLQDGD